MGTLLRERLMTAEAFGPVQLNKRAVERMMEDHLAGRCDHGQRLFALLTIAIWAREVWVS